MSTTSLSFMEKEPEDPNKPKTRGRKPKTPSQKKQPQRGMGVAKLEIEILKMQDGWTKITEITPQPQPQPPPSLSLHHNHFAYQTVEPIGGVPVFHGKPNFSGGRFMGFNPSGVGVQRVGSGGFCNGTGSGQVFMDRNRIGGVDPSFSVFETSKEKVQKCSPDSCDACFKKKRYNGDTSRFSGGTGDFLGFNHGEIPRTPRDSIFSGYNLNKGVEVKAVHKKENPKNGGSILMEYEFFPSGKSSYAPKEFEFPVAAGAGAGAVSSSSSSEASSMIYSPNLPSTSVDLSLKL